MSSKSKYKNAKNVFELAKIIGLEPEDAIEIDFRNQLNLKIIDVVKKKGLSHAEVAKLAKTSRTRVTAILNGNTSQVSTDLLLRILYSLGFRIKASFSPKKIAA